MNILHLLASDSFICTNKFMIKYLGLHEAILMGELASIYNYNKQKNTLEEDDWFYITIEKLEENTGLNAYKQKLALDNLENLGLIKRNYTGMPKRRYIRIDGTKLYEFLEKPHNFQLPNDLTSSDQMITPKTSNDLTSSDQMITQQVVKSFNINNNTYNNTNKNTYDNTTGDLSNKNNAILGENNQSTIESSKISAPTPPRVKKPKITAGSILPVKIQALLGKWNNHPETKQYMIDYCLFLMDTYSFKEAQLKNRISQLCKMANNVPEGIEIICEYNLNGGYGKLFKPNNYKKQLADCTVESVENTQEFIKDSEGNPVEVW